MKNAVILLKQSDCKYKPSKDGVLEDLSFLDEEELTGILKGIRNELVKYLDAELSYIILCKDSYLVEKEEECISKVCSFLDAKEIHILLAGPIIEDRTYAETCVHLCEALSKKYQIPAVVSCGYEFSGMPGWKQRVCIVRCDNSKTRIRQNVKALAVAANNYLKTNA